MFFPDLSPYAYTETREAAVNVGWLGRDAPFTTGQVSRIVRDHLVRMARNPTNLMRGLHDCEFCELESPIVEYVDGDPELRVFLGSGELWVRPGAVVYAAPTLIVHYIDAHAYAPPAEFCEAVRLLAQAENPNP